MNIRENQNVLAENLPDIESLNFRVWVAESATLTRRTAQSQIAYHRRGVESGTYQPLAPPHG